LGEIEVFQRSTWAHLFSSNPFPTLAGFAVQATANLSPFLPGLILAIGAAQGGSRL
jgi:hypothetical protein